MKIKNFFLHFYFQFDKKKLEFLCEINEISSSIVGVWARQEGGVRSLASIPETSVNVSLSQSPVQILNEDKI